MSRITKRDIKAIKEISISKGILKHIDGYTPHDLFKLIRDTEKAVKTQVLDILYNNDK